MNLMIERAFIAVLLLSISGFVSCFTFLTFEKFAYKLTSAKTMVFVNTVALFSFVVPFYMILSIIDGSESNFINYETVVFKNSSRYEWFVSIIRDFRFINYLETIWLIGILIFLMFYIWRYIYLINCVSKNKFYIEDDLWSIIFNILKNEKKISNVQLIGCCSIFTPCTIGIRNKYIVIPSYMINSFNKHEIELILKHEFCHVAYGDIPRKFLMMLLNCLNWFNPLYYFLRNNLSEWMEAACDEKMIENFSKEERFKYCQLLIKVLELERYKRKEKILSVNFTGIELNNYKRRMTKIMRKNDEKGIGGKVMVVSIALISMLSGNVVAKAADGPVNQMVSQKVDIVEAGELEVVEGTDTSFDDSFENEEYTGSSNFVILDIYNTADTTYEIIYHEDLNVVTTQEKMQEETKHIHKIVDVTLKEHKKASDGSCKTTYYEGRKCTSCGLVWKGDIIRSVYEAKCTH